MESLLSDIRYAARNLIKRPGFTAIAVLTLAIGIGANTTIFSTVDALILHPFSFPNQERLVVVWEQNKAVTFDSAKSFRTVPAAASAGSVAPIAVRSAPTASGFSSTIGMHGPDVMNETSERKNGRSRCTS